MGSRTRVPLAARSCLLRWFELIACVGLALWASRAGAQTISLAWQAPPECARASAVEARIRELSDALPSSQDTPIQARVQIAHARGRYQLRLQLAIGSHRAERRLHAARCDELSEAVVRLIALAIEAQTSPPDARQAAPESSPERTPAREGGRSAATGENSAPIGAQAPASKRTAEGAPSAAQTSDESARPEAAQIATPERRSTLRVVSKATDQPVERALRGGAAAGIFAGGPSAAQAALGAFLGWSAGWSYTQARFSGLLPRRVDIAPGASADVWSLALDLTQCALWGDKMRVGPCLTLSGLRSSAEVHGLSRAGRQAALWASASAGVQLFWRITVHLELSLSASAGLPISPRPRFTVAGVGPVATTKSWSSDARLGLSFRSK